MKGFIWARMQLMDNCAYSLIPVYTAVHNTYSVALLCFDALCSYIVYMYVFRVH